MNNIYNHRELALAYHRRLPERIRTYLLNIGICNSIICRYRIGWDGTRITIPITDRERRVTYFRLLRDPESDSSTAEILSWPEADYELFGWERVMSKREGAVICCGEVNRLILESHGIAAIALIEGFSSIPDAWARLLCQIPTLYICLSPNQAAETGVAILAVTVPHARIISIDAVGAGGIPGFFVKDRKTLEDFENLCTQAPRLDGQPITTDDDA